MKRGKNKKIQIPKKNPDKKIYFMTVRYLSLLIIIFSLPLIYKIISPLTVYPVSWLLKLFFNSVSLSQAIVNKELITILTINFKTFIQIIPACVAGSAYLLLLILNLTISINAKKRIYSLLFSFLLFLILNILRIFIFAVLYYNNSIFFDFTHKLFWYVLSTVFVIFIWLLTTRIFSIKEIPVYSDIIFLIKSINGKG